MTTNDTPDLKKSGTTDESARNAQPTGNDPDPPDESNVRGERGRGGSRPTGDGDGGPETPTGLGEAALRELFVDEGLTGVEIARELRMGERKVYAQLRGYDWFDGNMARALREAPHPDPHGTREDRKPVTDGSGVDLYADADDPEPVDPPEAAPENARIALIRVHEAKDGKHFCTVDADDDRFETAFDIEPVEAEVFEQDNARDRALSERLTPEPERTRTAPPVGAVTYDPDPFAIHGWVVDADAALQWLDDQEQRYRDLRAELLVDLATEFRNTADVLEVAATDLQAGQIDAEDAYHRVYDHVIGTPDTGDIFQVCINGRGRDD